MTAGHRLEAPLRNLRINGSLDTVDNEPHAKMDEMAAVCLRSVVGERPNSKPFCKKLRMWAIKASVGTWPLFLHQLEKAHHVAL